MNQISNIFIELICSKCGWLHFGQTFKRCTDQTNEFVDWYSAQPKETQEMYGLGHTKMKHFNQFLHCFRCGASYTEMKKPTKKQLKAIGSGHTIQPILIDEKPKYVRNR